MIYTLIESIVCHSVCVCVCVCACMHACMSVCVNVTVWSCIYIIVTAGGLNTDYYSFFFVMLFSKT